MVKTTDLLLIGGVGLAAAFFLGLFGKPEEAVPAVAGFPDLSWLADLLAGAATVPDIGASFFEGISQQLAAMQEQIGTVGTTIIEIPAELLRSGETVVGEGVEFLGITVDDLTKGILDYPGMIVGGLGERAAAAIPVWEPFGAFASIIPGLIFGFAVGGPIGAAAVGLGAGALGGFAAVPLAEQLKIGGIPTGLAPAAAAPVGKLPMEAIVEARAVARRTADVFVGGATGFAPGFTPRAPAAKADVSAYRVLTETGWVSTAFPEKYGGVSIAGKFIPFPG